jgi:hypothetical protein
VRLTHPDGRGGAFHDQRAQALSGTSVNQAFTLTGALRGLPSAAVVASLGRLSATSHSRDFRPTDHDLGAVAQLVGAVDHHTITQLELPPFRPAFAYKPDRRAYSRMLCLTSASCQPFEVIPHDLDGDVLQLPVRDFDPLIRDKAYRIDGQVPAVQVGGTACLSVYQ